MENNGYIALLDDVYDTEDEMALFTDVIKRNQINTLKYISFIKEYLIIIVTFTIHDIYKNLK